MTTVDASYNPDNVKYYVKSSKATPKTESLRLCQEC